MAIRIGTGADETLNTNLDLPADDFVWGAGGIDFIQTFDLDDEAHGGLGNDSILGGPGNDWLYGYGSGTPLFLFSLPSVQLEADDTINNGIGPGDDITFGGDDFITGGAGSDHVYGGGGNDTLYGSVAARSRGSGADFINGGAGDDLIYGGDGNDTIDGGSNGSALTTPVAGFDFDIAQYAGAFPSLPDGQPPYAITFDGINFQFTDKRGTTISEGTDKLLNVEAVQFSDDNNFFPVFYKWGGDQLGTSGGEVTWSYDNTNLEQFLPDAALPQNRDQILQLIRESFAGWQSAANITFKELTGVTAAQADIKIKFDPTIFDGNILGQTSVGSYENVNTLEALKTSYKSSSLELTDGSFDINLNVDLVTSGSIFAIDSKLAAVLAHETGHAIGLYHTSTAEPSLMTEFYSTADHTITEFDQAYAQLVYGPPNPINVTISDAAADEDTGGLTFTVSLSRPFDAGALVISPSIGSLNAQPNILKYSNANVFTQDIQALPITAATFNPGETVKTLTVPTRVDELAEPDEVFSFKIGLSTNTTGVEFIFSDDTAIGTILNDDGDPTPVVVTFTNGGFETELVDLLKQDVQAAVTRIEQALQANHVPDLEIAVVNKPIKGAAAAATPIYSQALELENGTAIELPNAIYEELFSDDPNGTAPDLTIFLDPEKVKSFYAGQSSEDVTALLTHEILHGLGFGGRETRAGHVTPWELMTSDLEFFRGTQADNKMVKLWPTDPAHLDAVGALMSPGTYGPNTPISAVENSIMRDLGFGDFSPLWLPAAGAYELIAGRDSSPSSKVTDGYIAGATVFADTNGNNTFDPGEASTTTDGAGAFAPIPALGRLVAIGGTDIAIGLPFRGHLSAPPGSTTITPLTTLIITLEKLGIADAEAKVLDAFGLPPTSDLTSLDPIAGTSGGNAQAALAFTAGISVLNTSTLVSSLLAGNNLTNYSRAFDATLGAFANLIASQNAPLDLASQEQVRGLIHDAAAIGSFTVDSVTIDGATSIIVALGASLTAASGSSGVALLSALSSIALVAQGAASDALKDVSDGLIAMSTAVDAFTAGNLTIAIDAAKEQVNDVDGPELQNKPAANSDALITDEDRAVASLLLANDGDPDGDALVVSSVNGLADNVGTQIALASGALLTVHMDGSVTYNPNGAFESLNNGQTATDTFDYAISDGHGGTANATATITINGVTDASVNQPPLAINDLLSVDENGPPASGSLLANDLDPDGDVLAVSEVNGVAASVGTQLILPSGAKLIVSANGTYTYDPNGAFASLQTGETGSDAFTYAIIDGQGGTSSATANVTIAGESSIAVTDAVQNILASNSGITVTSASYTGATAAFASLPTVNLGMVGSESLTLGPSLLLSSGNATIGSTNTSPGFSGSNGMPGHASLESVLTAAGFSALTHDAAVLTIAFTVSDPTATTISLDALFGSEEFPDYINNFVDIAGVFVDGQDYAFFDVDTPSTPLSVLSQNVSGGYFLNNSTAAAAGVPPTPLTTEYNGVSHKLTISGALDPTRTEHTLTIAIADTGDFVLDSGIFISNLKAGTGEVGINLSPIATDDALSANAVGPAVTGALLANDSDPDNDALAITTIAGLSVVAGGTVDLASGAKVTLNADGTTTYDPNGAFSGIPSGQSGADQFTYTISDGQGGTATGNVTVTIAGSNINHPPIVQDDMFATKEHTPLADENVLANDSDPNGDALVVAAVNGDTSSVGREVQLASGARLALNADGTFSYDPHAAFESLADGQTATDSFTYTAFDGQGHNVEATTKIVVTGVNDAPSIASSGGESSARYVIDEHTKFVTKLLATDPDSGDDITWSIVGGAKKSAFSIDEDSGALSLKRPADDHRAYSLVVKATDASGAFDTQKIRIDVADNHKMVGTSAADTFVFLPDFGRETVKKFDAAHDVLQIDHRLVGDQSVAEFLASENVSQHGADTWISFGEGHSRDCAWHHGRHNDDHGEHWNDFNQGVERIILANTLAASLVIDDFRFI